MVLCYICGKCIGEFEIDRLKLWIPWYAGKSCDGYIELVVV